MLAQHLSTADLSIWDHQCDCYLDVFAMPDLHNSFDAMHFAKFGDRAKLPSAPDSAASASAGFTISLGRVEQPGKGDDDDDDDDGGGKIPAKKSS